MFDSTEMAASMEEIIAFGTAVIVSPVSGDQQLVKLSELVFLLPRLRPLAECLGLVLRPRTALVVHDNLPERLFDGCGGAWAEGVELRADLGQRLPDFGWDDDSDS
jgi:hypothetical protein